MRTNTSSTLDIWLPMNRRSPSGSRHSRWNAVSQAPPRGRRSRCFRYRRREDRLPSRYSESQPRTTRLVDDARDIMARDLCSPLSVHAIAQELRITRRELERAFQQYLGVPPYQFLLVERLHAARRVLRRGEHSVLNACLECGFEDASRFTQMYSRQFGELPSKTRIRAR